MKFKRMLSALLCALLTVGTLMFTYASAEDGDTISMAYTNGICVGIVDREGTAVVEKDQIEDGKDVVMITPIPDGENSASKHIRLDAYELDKFKFDLTKFNYITIEYKYVTPNPAYTGKMTMAILPGKTKFVKEYTQYSSIDPIKSEGWQTAVFDISNIKDKMTDPENNPNLWQFHLHPFGSAKAATLTENDVMYIGNISFSSKAPEGYVVETGTIPTIDPTIVADGDLAFAYTDGVCKGLVDRQQTATVENNVVIDGKNTLKIIPDPNGADAGKLSVKLDAYEVDNKKIDLRLYNYMVVDYKYDTDTPKSNLKMYVNFLPGKTKILKKAMGYTAMDPLTNGGWQKAVFNISSVKQQLTDPTTESYLWQFHFQPFGASLASNLSTNDILYIGNITFTPNNPLPDREYKVEFTGGGATAGTAPETLSLKEGEKYVMPECTFEYENATFAGWMNTSNANKVYMPGTEMVMEANNVSYFAKWNIKKIVEDVKVLNYPTYYGGIIDKNNKFKDISFEDGIITVDGIETVMAKPNPNAETGVYFGFDGWNYGGAEIDTTQYKYAAILYKFDAAKEHDDFRTVFKVLRGGFTKGQVFTTDQPLKYGKWDLVTFDMTSSAEFVDANNPNIIQVHLLPFQEGKIRELDEGDTFYISKLIFFKEKPENISVHSQFIKGYEDGSFKPSGTMTRAEACTIITRLLTTESAIKGKYESAFTDVNSGDWYHDNIAYLENLGLLKSYSGTFIPNQPITRAEFVELVYNIGLLSGGDKNGAFTDVSADHPRYNVITAAGKAGLVNGYDNGDGTFSFKPDATITRAEVVKVINNAYGKKLYKNEYIAKFDPHPIFNDVGLDHWAYVDIMEATLPHGTYETSEHGEEWFYMSTPDIPVDYKTGNAKVAEVEALSSKRKAEILATPSKEFDIKGTKYYVSNDGNDSNDGKSPATAWATINKVNDSASSFNEGDAVYFNRGDFFRGHLNTKSGVTYSAYGEGAKPVIAGSPENGAGEDKWSLLEGTTNIWVYKNKIVDVGGIVVNNGGSDFILEKTLATFFDSKTGKYYKDKTEIFDPTVDIPNNSFFNNQASKDFMITKGDLYLRCDEGNPGKIYNSIEFLHGAASVISAKSNVTIDNLAIKYGGRHGIGAGTVNNLIISNCEIGWIGGGIHTMNNAGDGLYTVTRFGNGVEVYGGCDNFVIDNCYVYQCFDAGITNQYQRGGAEAVIEKNVVFSNNLIEYCCYNIEYFMGVADSNVTRLLQNVLYENNICRMAGFGWGRINPTNSANIKGWDHYNMADNFVIRNNIFDRAYGDLLHIGAQQIGWFPKMSGNTYIQFKDSSFGHIGQNATTAFEYNAGTANEVANILPNDTSNFYFVEPRN